MSRLCTNCGGELKDGAKFCPNCGAKVEAAVEAPVETAFAAPEQPSYAAPEQPSYAAPEQPSYAAPEQPSYGAPQQPSYAAPQQPSYGAPQQPSYGAPQQPSYGSPQQPSYGAPQQPSYGAPQQPSYAAPQQPSYGVPQQPNYGVPQQPNYGVPQQPNYGAAPAYGNAGYGVQTQPQPKKSKVGLIIGIAAGAIVIIAGIVILAVFLLGGGDDKGASTPQDAINSFGVTIDKMFHGNASFEDLLGNVYEWNYMKPEMKTYVQDEVDDAKKEFDSSIALLTAFYDDFSISCKMIDSVTMSESEMKDYLEDNEIDTYCTTDKITEICTCTVEYTMSYGGETDTSTNEMVCIKADGKWYLSMSEMSL